MATPYVWRDSSLVGDIMMTPVPRSKEILKIIFQLQQTANTQFWFGTAALIGKQNKLCQFQLQLVQLWVLPCLNSTTSSTQMVNIFINVSSFVKHSLANRYST